LQQDATPEKIAETAHKLLSDKALQTDIKEEFTRMHHQLRQNTAEKAAEAILKFL